MNNAIDWKLGLWWSLATIGGLVLGLVILFAGLGAAINNAPPFLFGLVIGCTFGLGCAVMQWICFAPTRFCLVDCSNVCSLGNLLGHQSCRIPW